MTSTNRGSNRVLRYGFGNYLYRILSVRMNDNVSCKGSRPLHRVEAVRVDNGLPSSWWIKDDELARYV